MKTSRTALNLTQGRPLKLILLFAIPVFLGNLFQILYNLVDTKIVGSILGEERRVVALYAAHRFF